LRNRDSTHYQVNGAKSPARTNDQFLDIDILDFEQIVQSALHQSIFFQLIVAFVCEHLGRFDEDLCDACGQAGNKCARESGFHRANFIRKLIRGLPVKRNSYREFLRWLGNRKIVNE
jgi:hypothetical protein